MKRTSRACFFAFLLIIAGAAMSPARAARVRIGVFTLFHPKKLMLAPAPGGALVIEGGKTSIVLEAGDFARCRVEGGRVECRASEHLLRATTVRVAGRGDTDEDFTLSVPKKIVRSYRGKLQILASQEELLPVVNMELEIAVASAVAAESPPGAPLEALKAQAIVTRSYYVAARHRHTLFDFCDTTHCQFLRGVPAAESAASRAAALTRGLVLLYRGSVVPALFSASCGGRTRMPGEIGLTAGNYPYFSVRCAPCLKNTKTWTAKLSLEDAAPILEHKGSEQARLQIDRKLGWETIPSDNYSMEIEGRTVVLSGRGTGHGVGLCQLGANALAREGWNASRILAYYFPGTALGDFTPSQGKSATLLDMSQEFAAHANRAC